MCIWFSLLKLLSLIFISIWMHLKYRQTIKTCDQCRFRSAFAFVQPESCCSVMVSGAFTWTEFLCISVLRIASGPRVKLTSCKSALNLPVVYSTNHSKAVVPVLVLLFVALWFILQSDLFYVLPCVILFFCFSVLLALQLPRLGKEDLILVVFIHLFNLRLFGFVCFLFLLVSGKGYGLWLWHSLGFSLTFFFQAIQCKIAKIKNLLQICRCDDLGLVTHNIKWVFNPFSPINQNRRLCK